jgi:hypothetical protein
MFDGQTTDAFDAWLDGLDKTPQRPWAAIALARQL